MEFAGPGPATDPSNPCPWLWVFLRGRQFFSLGERILLNVNKDDTKAWHVIRLQEPLGRAAVLKLQPAGVTAKSLGLKWQTVAFFFHSL